LTHWMLTFFLRRGNLKLALKLMENWTAGWHAVRIVSQSQLQVIYPKP